MRHKPDAAEMFEQFLADTRADGIPSKVVIVRSDGGGEFHGGNVNREVSRKNSTRPTVDNSMR